MSPLLGHYIFFIIYIFIFINVIIWMDPNSDYYYFYRYDYCIGVVYTNYVVPTYVCAAHHPLAAKTALLFPYANDIRVNNRISKSAPKRCRSLAGAIV